MTLPLNKQQREVEKFKDVEGEVAVRVTKAEADLLELRATNNEILSCLGKILEQLEIQNKHLEILTDEEI